MNRPVVVTLCGSSRFKEEHERAQREETLLGKIVIPMGLYGHLDGLDMSGPVKRMLDELHLRKIDISHEVLAVTPDGTVGESTARELIYASRKGNVRLFAYHPELKVKQGADPELREDFQDEFLGFYFLVPKWLEE